MIYAPKIVKFNSRWTSLFLVHNMCRNWIFAPLGYIPVFWKNKWMLHVCPVRCHSAYLKRFNLIRKYYLFFVEDSPVETAFDFCDIRYLQIHNIFGSDWSVYALWHLTGHTCSIHFVFQIWRLHNLWKANK